MSAATKSPTSRAKRALVKPKPTLLYTIPETARELRLHRSTVYRRIRDGLLEAVDIADPGASTTELRVPLEAIRAFIAKLPRVHADAP